MDKRKLMLLLGAMVVALGSMLAVRGMMPSRVVPMARAAVPAPTGPRVLVAQRGLAVGTIITPDAVAFQAWPRDMVQDAYFLDGSTDRAKLIGTVVRNPITAGQPLTQGALVAPGDRGFLAAALGPGMRAVTIAVSDMSGVAGFIFPGDHVDMMLTQTIKPTAQQAAGVPLAITETILRDLRVLATDQTTETEIAPGGKSVVKIAHDVTLEVTPRVAEKIEVAQSLGLLSLSLRALADDQSGLERALANGRPIPAGAAANRPIANPSAEGATSFSTGGDVSRFSRRGLAANRDRIAPAIAGPMSPAVRVARGNTETATPPGNAMSASLPGSGGAPGTTAMPTPMVGGF